MINAIVPQDKEKSKELLTAALAYAAAGYSVVPLLPKGKKPAIAWQKYQNERANAETLRGWWAQWPEANVGIVTGAISGVIVLDVDGPAGIETLKGKELPPTLASRTGGGGWHYIFKHPGGTVQNFARRLPGLDLRADGGYIVAPPSVHESGKSYEWAIEDPPAAAPAWLLELITAPAANGHAVTAANWADSLEDGKRNVELTRRAGSLLAKMSAADALPMLQAWNAERCKPPLPADEVRAVVESIANREAQKDDTPPKESQADAIIRQALDALELFHDELGDGFARVRVGEHQEIHKLRGKFFRQWLVKCYYDQTKRAPYSEAVAQAISVLEAVAVFSGAKHELALRVAVHDGAIWYDLADEKWSAVKITAAGWEVVTSPPILFRRYKNTAAQVIPQRGGELKTLAKYVNLKNADDVLLLFGVTATALIPNIPHVVSVFFGDKGSAKSTAQRVLRKIIDPAHIEALTLPTDKSELALTLMTNYAPGFDNLDGLQGWQSDMLCQAATGGGLSKRELYSDMDEVILSFRRAPMLNGINLVASRDDILDRGVLFQLERIDEQNRMEEAIFWEMFEADRPLILGALFDVISAAMRLHPAVKLKRLPRMADFARWGYAVSQARAAEGDQFLSAYFANIACAVEEAVAADAVSAATLEFMATREHWEDTATALLQQLTALPSTDAGAKGWPKRPHTLTRKLNKMKSALSDMGIKITTDREDKKRLIRIVKNLCTGAFSRDEKIASYASYASQVNGGKGLVNDAWKVKASGNVPSVMKASCHKVNETSSHDANDANDANLGNIEKLSREPFFEEEEF